MQLRVSTVVFKPQNPKTTHWSQERGTKTKVMSFHLKQQKPETVESKQLQLAEILNQKPELRSNPEGSGKMGDYKSGIQNLFNPINH